MTRTDFGRARQERRAARRYVHRKFSDLETTGLNPASEEITEIAAVRVVEGEIRDSFQTYVNPHKPIPAEITELTGISDETVADAPDLDKAVPEFLAWAGEGQYPLVAHNAGFDMGFPAGRPARDWVSSGSLRALIPSR